MKTSALVILIVAIYYAKSVDSNNANNGIVCPNGWFHYEESCYWFSRWGDKKSFAAARMACTGMDATLFVSNARSEFDAVIRQASRTEWTWIGLTAESTHPGDANYFKWETPNAGMDISLLPWLNRIAPAHGQISARNCVGYYGGLNREAAYVHWYSCDLTYHYICKKKFAHQ